jgi:hypothetical protein
MASAPSAHRQPARAETTSAALGRLAALRDRLRKERAGLETEHPDAEKFYETVTLDTLHGRVWSAEERKQIDPVLKARNRLLKRVAKIDAELARIQHEGVAIKKHCTASADEIRAEAAKHVKKLHDAETLELGMKLARNARFQRKMLRELGE